FGEEEKVTKLPKYEGIWKLKDYLSDTLYYYINHLTEVKGAEYALYLIIGIIIFIFLLKNLFGFLGLQHLMKLKTGVLRDFRDKMYDKIVDLPVSYYSEKRKGDVMARMLGRSEERRVGKEGRCGWGGKQEKKEK